MNEASIRNVNESMPTGQRAIGTKLCNAIHSKVILNPDPPMGRHIKKIKLMDNE